MLLRTILSESNPYLSAIPVKTFAHVSSSSRQVHPSGRPKADHDFGQLVVLICSST